MDFLSNISHFGPDPRAETNCLETTGQAISSKNYEKCFIVYLSYWPLPFHMNITFVVDATILCRRKAEYLPIPEKFGAESRYFLGMD